MLANCTPAFRAEIAALAAATNQTTEAVYTLWQEYCRDCATYDQSPVLPEFRRWHGLDEPTAGDPDKAIIL